MLMRVKLPPELEDNNNQRNNDEELFAHKKLYCVKTSAALRNCKAIFR